MNTRDDTCECCVKTVEIMGIWGHFLEKKN